MAALYHDIGKPETYQIDEAGEIHFYNHARAGAELVVLRAQQLHLSNMEILRLHRIVENHMRPLFLARTGAPLSRRATYRFFRDCGEAGVDICLLSLADTLATYGPELPQNIWIEQLDTVRELLSAYWENKEERIHPPALISGLDLINTFKMDPGPKIGELLEALRESQVEGEVTDRQEALQFADAWLQARE